MNAALKLTTAYATPATLTSVQPAGDILAGLQLLGWTNLPVRAVSALEEDIRVYLEELMTVSSHCDADKAKRRRKIVFWIEAYLRNECTLDWMLQMVDRQAS